jgi:DNA modification methylase
MSFDIGTLDRSAEIFSGYRTKKKAKVTASSSVKPQVEYSLHLCDAFAWLESREENSIHAIVTDPPYGLKEYTDDEKAKLRSGRGGVWRIPPSFDGHKRSPVPRFTVLNEADITALYSFFEKFAKQAMRVLVPGGHVIIATNPLLSQHVYLPMIEAGFEKRGEIIRLVQTLRGGDRPKNAHMEFTEVSVMPRSGWEPWGLFRKPCEGRVQDNLRKWGTGGLRRISGHNPFLDVIRSAVARGEERGIAPHPSLKPQGLMRQLVRAVLPLGLGVILDPFMGSGSTIAAAVAVGYTSIGIEKDLTYFSVAKKAIPLLARYSPSARRLAKLKPRGTLAVTKRSKSKSYRKGRRVRRSANGGTHRHLS